jgi:colanic acid/amylovoran biosynthesis glycosyltransferase
MDKLTVAHFINPFLPLTQNWIYHQLQYNTECRSVVLCQTLQNTEQFPFPNVFAAFPQPSPLSTASMLLARLRARYFPGFYLSVIRREQPQVLHGHFSWESWRNIGIVKKTRIPLITTFYGLDVNKLARKRVWRRRYAHLFDIGDLFTVEGGFMASALAAIGCPEKKIRIVPLGVDTEKLCGYRVPSDGKKLSILFVGLEREKKGAPYAAAAFARASAKNPNCELHVVGNGPYAPVMKKILSAAGVIDKCVFHGYIPFETYCRLLGRIDILMAPSVLAKNGDTEGGSPVVVTEAQAAGIPVVATRHCDIPNIVVDRQTGLLCEERDIESLAANLTKLIEDSELRNRMGGAAKAFAAEHFSIQRQVCELTRIYQSMV